MVMATDKQKALIKRIERYLPVKYEGNSVKDASAFITKHLPEYREVVEICSSAMYDALMVGDH